MPKFLDEARKFLSNKTLLQLGREFRWPFLLAFIWTAYSLISDDTDYSLKRIVGIFGPSFFLISWAGAQVLRVRKQASVDDNLTRIVGTVTGGNSMPEVKPSFALEESGSPLRLKILHPTTLTLQVRGEHSVYDLTVNLVDIEKMRSCLASGQTLGQGEYQYKFQVGTMGIEYEHVLLNFNPGTSDKCSFHIDSTARNGRFHQRLLLRKVNGTWLQATRILHGDTAVYELIDPGFPHDGLPPVDPTSPVL